MRENILVSLSCDKHDLTTRFPSRYRVFLAQGGLDEKIYSLLDSLDVAKVDNLVEAGASIRKWICETPFPPELIAEITKMYA